MKKHQHFLKLNDLTRAHLELILERSGDIKGKSDATNEDLTMRGKTLVMIFEKQSTRTRLSFEIGMQQMGGYAVYLNTKDSQLDRGEPIEDSAKVISRMCDIIMIRTFQQSFIERFASFSRVPVINGLTNDYHPCQILADIFTFQERRGSINGKTVAWIGDCNNVSRTWIQASKVLNFNLHISTPPEYQSQTMKIAAKEKTKITFWENPKDAVKNSDLVTTDVWTSMGFESEVKARKSTFKNWQVTSEMMNAANQEAIFMHCLPANRGEEVASDVIDGEKSVVWDQAENRLHVQKALIEFLIKKKNAN